MKIRITDSENILNQNTLDVMIIKKIFLDQKIFSLE